MYIDFQLKDNEAFVRCRDSFKLIYPAKCNSSVDVATTYLYLNNVSNKPLKIATNERRSGSNWQGDVVINSNSLKEEIVHLSRDKDNISLRAIISKTLVGAKLNQYFIDYYDKLSGVDKKDFKKLYKIGDNVFMVIVQYYNTVRYIQMVKDNILCISEIDVTSDYVASLGNSFEEISFEDLYKYKCKNTKIIDKLALKVKEYLSGIENYQQFQYTYIKKGNNTELYILFSIRYLNEPASTINKCCEVIRNNTKQNVYLVDVVNITDCGYTYASLDNLHPFLLKIVISHDKYRIAPTKINRINMTVIDSEYSKTNEGKSFYEGHHLGYCQCYNPEEVKERHLNYLDIDFIVNKFNSNDGWIYMDHSSNKKTYRNGRERAVILYKSLKFKEILDIN